MQRAVNRIVVKCLQLICAVYAADRAVRFVFVGKCEYNVTNVTLVAVKSTGHW